MSQPDDAFLLQEVLEDYRGKQKREGLACRFQMADHYMRCAHALERAVKRAASEMETV